MCLPTPRFLWDLGERKVKFGSKRAIFGVIMGGFEGFGPCLGISHPRHPHLGKPYQLKPFFSVISFESICNIDLKASFISYYKGWVGFKLWRQWRAGLSCSSERDRGSDNWQQDSKRQIFLKCDEVSRRCRSMAASFQAGLQPLLCDRFLNCQPHHVEKNLALTRSEFTWRHLYSRRDNKVCFDLLGLLSWV